ncbi:MAG: YqhA family protein [Betaproteobacteria bacterium]|nr:YqhA family protein [Betaproteobacteria bacterium]MBU6513250.1 YqhA family protein [Betaproteobacteria bacterium]MDE1956690.1 YqhA family protein [Betaproteobacteria bacterium]MDE2152028.1 YqhA family protein [Betaproteobacteria bacterium]MDE2480500.1 YqhA family protein [Betaproteobacteria bacterium]
MSAPSRPKPPVPPIPAVARLLFLSRWLQLPLYVGLIVALGVYVVHFWMELFDLVRAAMGSHLALQHLLEGQAAGQAAELGPPPTRLGETTIMLVALSLIDVVMIANLLIMVIVGGYETFVSRTYLEQHPDHPEWLSHVNASVLKVKLAMAIIGISSIHLLRTFINADAYSVKALVAQTAIHITFLVSALAVAWTDRVMTRTIHMGEEHEAASP